MGILYLASVGVAAYCVLTGDLAHAGLLLLLSLHIKGNTTVVIPMVRRA